MCTDALVRWLVAFALLALAAPAAASQEGKVPPGAVKAAVKAAEKVEREMWREGANQSKVLGCWRSGSAVVDCTGVVKGNDGFVIWRCMLQIRVRKRDAGGHRAKLTDAVCVAEEVAKSPR